MRRAILLCALCVLGLAACGKSDSGNDGGGGGAGGGSGGGEAGGAGGGTAGGAGGGGGEEVDAGVPCTTPGTYAGCTVAGPTGACTTSVVCTEAHVYSNCGEFVPDICDGQDNDCDGVVDNPKNACTCSGSGGEICGNHVDDDCDGIVDCPGEIGGAYKLGGAPADVIIQSVSATDAGVFISGRLFGEHNFSDTGAPIGTNDGGFSIFVARLDPSTQRAVWQRALPAPLFGGGTTVYAEPKTGDVYWTGSYQNYISLDGTDGGLSDTAQSGDSAAFVARLSGSDGQPQNALFIRSPQSSATGFGRYAQLAGRTADGGIVIVGTFDNTVQFAPSNTTMTATSGFFEGDIYIAELSPSLQVRTYYPFLAPGAQYVSSARTDGTSLVWVGGSTQASFDVGGRHIDYSNGPSGGYAFAYDLVADAGVEAISVNGSLEFLTQTGGVYVAGVEPGATRGSVYLTGRVTRSGGAGDAGCPLSPSTEGAVFALEWNKGCVWHRSVIGGDGYPPMSVGSNSVTVAGVAGNRFDFDGGTYNPTSAMAGWVATFARDGGQLVAFEKDGPNARVTYGMNAGTSGYIAGSFNTWDGGTANLWGQSFSSTNGENQGLLLRINR